MPPRRLNSSHIPARAWTAGGQTLSRPPPGIPDENDPPKYGSREGTCGADWHRVLAVTFSRSAVARIGAITDSSNASSASTKVSSTRRRFWIPWKLHRTQDSFLAHPPTTGRSMPDDPWQPAVISRARTQKHRPRRPESALSSLTRFPLRPPPGFETRNARPAWRAEKSKRARHHRGQIGASSTARPGPAQDREARNDPSRENP